MLRNHLIRWGPFGQIKKILKLIPSLVSFLPCMVTYSESWYLSMNFCGWPLFCLQQVHYFCRTLIPIKCLLHYRDWKCEIMCPLGILQNFKGMKPWLIAYQMYTLSFLSKSLAKTIQLETF